MSRSELGGPRSGARGAGALGVVTLALVAMGLGACGGEERLAPVPTEGEGAGGATSSSASVGSTSASSSTSTGAGGGTPIREVFTRNPMGDQTDNLLADGDFELSVVGGSGQHGWIAFAIGGQGNLQAETGGLCRSGLRCARVAPGGALFARGTSAPDKAAMVAELWVKPADPAGSCGGLRVVAVACDSGLTRGALQGLVAPEADGWCPIRGPISGDETATCLYLENDGIETLLVDQASLRVDPTPDRSLPVRSAPPDLERAARRAVEHVRKTLPLGRPPRLPPGARPRPGMPALDPEQDPRP